MGFSRPEDWSGLPFPSPGDLPNPAIEPRSPALQADSLPAEPPGKPKNTGVGSWSLLQGIFLTWELNQGLLQADSLPTELWGKTNGFACVSVNRIKEQTVRVYKYECHGNWSEDVSEVRDSPAGYLWIWQWDGVLLTPAESEACPQTSALLRWALLPSSSFGQGLLLAVLTAVPLSQHLEHTGRRAIRYGGPRHLCFDVRGEQVILQNCTEGAPAVHQQHWDHQEVSDPPRRSSQGRWRAPVWFFREVKSYRTSLCPCGWT